MASLTEIQRSKIKIFYNPNCVFLSNHDNSTVENSFGPFWRIALMLILSRGVWTMSFICCVPSARSIKKITANNRTHARYQTTAFCGRGANIAAFAETSPPSTLRNKGLSSSRVNLYRFTASISAVVLNSKSQYELTKKHTHHVKINYNNQISKLDLDIFGKKTIPHLKLSAGYN